MSSIYLIAGAPASGKSTASRGLAAAFPKSIAIPVDDLRCMVVSGIVHPSAEWSDELAEQLRLARGAAAAMARAYHAAGYTAVIDDFWDPQSRLAEYDVLLGAEMRRVLLMPDQAQAHAQNLARSGPGQLRDYLDEGIRICYADLRDSAERLRGDGWHIFDTTGDTPSATVARLLALGV